MARPRKDHNLLLLSGTAQKHPGRYADVSPVETKGPIGDPPEDFLRATPEMQKHAALWRKLVDEAPIGVLSFSDREFLESTVRWGILSKRDSTKGQQRALEQYAKNLKSLGMTPEGRAIRGLGGKAPTKVVNPLEEFRKKRRRAS